VIWIYQKITQNIVTNLIVNLYKITIF